MYREPGGVVFVNSRGFRIRYQVSGSGPVLVLLHGFPMWGDRWRDRGYVSVLQGRFHLVVPDLLGHGKSDKPHRPADYGVPNLASDVIAVLDAAGVERAHFWGYSLGTMVAENLAVTVPDRVLSLTLGGFPPGLDLDQRRAMFPPAKAPASWDEIFHGWPEPLIDLYKANTDLAAVQAIWASLCEQATTIADLQSSPHPTLGYIGAEDPLLEVTRLQCAALPCRLEVVPGDHMAGFAQAGNVCFGHADAGGRLPIPACIASIVSVTMMLAVSYGLRGTFSALTCCAPSSTGPYAPGRSAAQREGTEHSVMHPPCLRADRHQAKTRFGDPAQAASHRRSRCGAAGRRIGWMSGIRI